MADRQRYHPAALDSAFAFVRSATSAQTARTFGLLIAARGNAENDLVDLPRDIDPGRFEDLDGRRRSIDAANGDFVTAFGVPLVSRLPAAFDEAKGRDPVCVGSRQVRLSPAFVDLLDRPINGIACEGMPEPDFMTAKWVAVAAACPGSGRGHHLALRCIEHGARELMDFARLIACRLTEVRFADSCGDSVEMAVLRAELHRGAAPGLVVMDREPLTIENDHEDDTWDMPKVANSASTSLSSHEAHRLQRLRVVRNTYVWRAPANFVVEAELAAFYGGAMGPIMPSTAWRDGVVADLIPGIGAVGTRAILSRIKDPRDAGALAGMASVAATAAGIDLDEAAVFVVDSLSDARHSLPGTPPDFDARLVNCDEEGQLLLARAVELARLGGCVLLWGPPGGGKSTFAQALAGAMGRRAEVVTGASILARHWGVTERIIADVWSRAARDGATLIIDELDSLCGVREPGVSSGNAYLIRSLTNEFLRAFDAHAAVPVIATANDLASIDPAVRRRFTFVIEVGGELTPEAELLAWRSLLRIDPPPDWVPTGANVSDFANAERRCRMLGLFDPVSLAAGIARSQNARLGPRPRAAAARPPPDGGPIH